AGPGSTLHVAAELFKIMTGVDLVHVPYRGGGPAIADAISGQVQAVFIPAPAGIEYVRSGQLRALGVSSATRFVVLPDVPSISEFVSVASRLQQSGRRRNREVGKSDPNG